MYNDLRNCLEKHEDWRNSCLNLVPSENVLSPAAKEAFQSDMGQRYFFKLPFSYNNKISYAYRGTKFISSLVEIGEDLAKEIFRVKSASLYPLSGHTAVIATLFSFCDHKDTIMCHNPDFGGYPGLSKGKLPRHLGLNVEYFPIGSNAPERINIEETEILIAEKKPKMIIFSSAHTLFPIPIEKIKKTCEAVGSIICYDGSHPLGLIAGHQFQDPLKEGCDLLVGSTHKSFPGPQGGIILTNDYDEKIDESIHFSTVDNPHFNRIAALAITLAEMKEFGKVYAKQIVRNAQSLGQYLYDNGIPVKYKNKKFTRSHQIKIEMNKSFYRFVQKLEEANIILDNSGRIGCSEMTRYGMKENEMKIIAEFISRIYEGTSQNRIKKEVKEFRSRYQEIMYCFK